MGKEKVEGICKYCLQYKVLLNSHILPKSFQKFIKDENNDMVVIDTKHQYSKRTQNGLFQKGLLCFECEQEFSKVETYTTKFLTNFIEGTSEPTRVIHNNYATNYLYNLDGKKVKKCLLSILWRMSITNLYEFDRVDLGTIENKLRNGLYQDNFMDDKFFPVSLMSTKLIKGYHSRILYPPIGRFKYMNQSFYVLIIPQLMILFYASDSIRFNIDDIGLIENGMIKINEEKGDSTRQLLLEHYKKIPDFTKWNLVKPRKV